MKPLNLDSIWLRRKYVDERVRTREIAKLANCSCTSINRYLSKYGIPKRRKGSREDRILYLPMSGDLAYVLGALASDGCASYLRKEGEYRIQLTVKDKPFAEEFARRIRALGLSAVVRQLKDGYYRVAKGCKEIYEYYKKIPSVLETLDQKRNFIEGYYDGDGSLYLDKKGYYHLSISSTVRKKAELISTLLKEVGISTHIYSYICRRQWRGIKEKHEVVIHKRVDVIKFAKEIGSSIPRKRPSLLLLDKKNYRQGYSEEEMLEWLRQVSAELGKSPSVSDMNQHPNAPSAQAYKHRFGSWNAAKKFARLKTFEPGWIGMVQAKKELVNLGA